MLWVFKEGEIAKYKSGPALIGGYVTWLYDAKGNKLAAKTFNNLETAKRWGRRKRQKGIQWTI